ncbi:MAG TPA: ATPase, T2SS/T4P/T4SS family [Nitrolancea sp.]|nr:ATPase, T2SS/T4P/T4SS family [Nitrolancea sp.]
MSFDLILPFIRPLEPLLEDREVSEIMVNGPHQVYVERRGRLEAVPDLGLAEKHLQVAIRNIARVLGEDISEEMPILDARLPDGSRVAAVWPPCSVNGPTLTIRRFQYRQYTLDELVRIGTISAPALATITTAIEARENVLISGATATGKTTLLNAIASLLPEDDRIILIEDTAELHLAKPHLVRFEARRAQPGLPAVTIRDLVIASLRHRPDRILLGEVRGGEAYDLIQALNTGHAGTFSTIHASSAQQVLARLASCVLQSGVELPYAAIRHQIADHLRWIVHLERRHGVRRVREILQIVGYQSDLDRYRFTVAHTTS